jgi:predicted nicotinamide N-methyase
MSPSYNTRLDTVSVAGVYYRIRSLSDLQQFDDPQQLAEQCGISSATWPLFGVLWPSGLMLAEIMSTRDVAGLDILEIGCGLGLASMIANRRGGKITASDYHPLAEEFMAENARLNDLQVTRFKQCDWSKPITGLGTFDLIIGSDLLYEPDHPQMLSRFIDVHARAGASVIIVDPGRRQLSKFRKKMSQLGYESCSDVASARTMKEHNFKGNVTRYFRHAA